MSDAESKTRSETAALIRRYYEAFNTRRRRRHARLPDRGRDPRRQPGRAPRLGKERFRAFNARMAHHYRERLEDIAVMVSKDGSRAAAEFNVNGTYLITDSGLPAAQGQTYMLPAGAFFAIRDGKISRVTTYYNLTDWIAQVTG